MRKTIPPLLVILLLLSAGCVRDLSPTLPAELGAASITAEQTAASTAAKPTAVPGTTAVQELRLPILMYHQLTTKPERTHELCITLELFKQDLDEIEKKGYTPVSMAQVIDFCEQGKPLPPKPIVLSFDDGYESFYVYAYPLLKERKMHATLAVIGWVADRFSKVSDHRLKYSCCTWEQLREMAEDGTAEVLSHSWDLHTMEKGRNGAAQKKGESIEDYRAALAEDMEYMHKAFERAKLPDVPVFVYPYGAFSPDSAEILRSLGIRAAFQCDSRVNILRAGDTDALMRLGRFNRPPGKPLPIE
ncbi:MAG: polysaccharide deacetylase family protein [Oscillospiraceae bacterium]|jgi:peptidoglycan/xylan/chitin deacetylase (PgdA/CDA1 family)|nr:polysaccharide deacetylase family protein [Oscillospiraceae bacterium]